MTYDELIKKIAINNKVAEKFLHEATDKNNSAEHRKMAGNLLLKTIRENLELSQICLNITKDMI